ncbi:MAG: lipid A export permease/ATP-binding protein MsbA [Gammaproteobacteria bacterium]|nr:lipid A export permease/ATP-binding protein MsbA [Gammaproteobacteria bacterium]
MSDSSISDQIIASDKEKNRQIYRRLIQYVKPYWKAFMLALICNAAYGYIDTEFVKAFKPLLDEGLSKKNPDYLLLAPLFVIGILIVRGITGFIATYCMAWVGNHIVMEMRQAVFNRYLQLPASFFDSRKTGELLSMVTYNTEQLNKSTTTAVTTIVRDVALICFALIGMFSESWRLTLLFLITGPLIAFLVNIISKRFRMISKRIQKAMGSITHTTQESIESYQEIRIYGGQDYEKETFRRINNNNRQQSMKMELTKASSVPIIQLLAGFGLALVLYFAVGMVIAEQLTPGGFTSMVLLMMLTLKPLKSLSSVNDILQRGIAAAESVFDILDRKPEQDTGKLTIEKSKGKISFEDVCFQYPNAKSQAIKNISIEIPSGKTVALVGRSGSGKSTLTSLLLRFYTIDSGTIKLDGHSITEYQLQDYRKQFAFVSQHVNLFNDSIAHNIAYGNLEHSTRDDIIHAAKQAHAWEFISELPDGLDTMIGEKGMLLSGGQRQRLAIARAILKNAPILILDEATSALDTESEKVIQQAMNRVMNNKTTLVVAHRLSTIENADQIIVMDQGRICESGTHAELQQKGGVYAGLHQMQFKD